MFEKGNINLGNILSTALGVLVAVVIVHAIGKNMTKQTTTTTTPLANTKDGDSN